MPTLMNILISIFMGMRIMQKQTSGTAWFMIQDSLQSCNTAQLKFHYVSFFLNRAFLIFIA